MEDDLWRLQQQSRYLQQYRSELQPAWDDTAARDLNRRYFEPHARGDAKMRQAFMAQYDHCQQAELGRTMSDHHGRQVAQFAEHIAQHLRAAASASATARDQIEISRRLQDEASARFDAVASLLALAHGACGGGATAICRPPGAGGWYRYMANPSDVAPGKSFSPSQREAIIRENMRRNGGAVRSDLSGRILLRPQKSQRGVVPSPDEWQIDHMESRDGGGSNAFANAQVLARIENRIKGNR